MLIHASKDFHPMPWGYKLLCIEHLFCPIKRQYNYILALAVSCCAKHSPSIAKSKFGSLTKFRWESDQIQTQKKYLANQTVWATLPQFIVSSFMWSFGGNTLWFNVNKYILVLKSYSIGQVCVLGFVWGNIFMLWNARSIPCSFWSIRNGPRTWGLPAKVEETAWRCRLCFCGIWRQQAQLARCCCL